MADKFTWYLPDDPVTPKDHYWYLVADTRVATPMKAKYHDDIDYFEYSTSLEQVYGAYRYEGFIKAWMPIPEFYD